MLIWVFWLVSHTQTSAILSKKPPLIAMLAPLLVLQWGFWVGFGTLANAGFRLVFFLIGGGSDYLTARF